MLSLGVVRNPLALRSNERNHIKMKFAPKAHNLLAAIAAIIAVPTLAQVDASPTVDPEVEDRARYFISAAAIAFATAIIVLVGDDNDAPVSA